MAASSPSMFCAAAGSSVSSLSSPSNASTTGYAVPQVFDEMPQQYDFHNLCHKTVFLSDGIERNYYALPEDYSLKKATPPLYPSAAIRVGAMAPLFVAAQSAGLVPVCCPKANSTAGSESLLAPKLQLPMNVQADHKVIKEMHVPEEKKQDNEHLLECFSKAPETEQTSADRLDFTFELQQQIDEKTDRKSVV